MICDFYGRKSSEDNGRSVAGQESDWRSDCEDEGFTPGRAFADPSRSASRYARQPRPDFAELIEHIRSGQCEMLALWEASRGSRALGEWVSLLDLCISTGTLIRIIGEQRTYDVCKRRDYRDLAADGIKARDDSEEISERTQRGKRAAALKGTPPGRLLYGYRRVYDGRGNYMEQVEHPQEAAVVREIARRVMAGESLRAVARSLDERGITTPTGKPWRSGNMGKTIIRPAYAGLRVHQGRVVGKADWPALLDEETYDTCVAILTDPSRITARGTALKHMLSGIMSCGACGTGVLGTRTINGGRSYSCPCHRVSIQADALDGFVTKLVRALLARPGNEDLFTRRMDGSAVAAAKAAERRLRARLDEHYREAAAGNLSATGLGAVEALLLPQIEAAAAKARAITTPPKLRGLTPEIVAKRWDSLAVTIRREVVRAVVDLRVDPGVRGRARFDRGRLNGSRWVGDTHTWGELG